ncbi:uncharacterized protein N7484_005323 [Penicillium longicatenatum]|uniref:uncharacterized protein n=1 Tax=Penicillium longicatenatum TaxID=1561947 RepID=UPI0025496A09|nr:uncharacterized protein N7484_005323 [Penicillium longicatenatum]KAJ5651600.1 hypothetical protein N7484_005323 [Penicillium longicatenatum]
MCDLAVLSDLTGSELSFDGSCGSISSMASICSLDFLRDSVDSDSVDSDDESSLTCLYKMGENVFPTEAPRSASLESGASPRPEPRDETAEPASGLAIDPQNPSFTSYREATRHESEASTSTRPYIRPALA